MIAKVIQPINSSNSQIFHIHMGLDTEARARYHCPHLPLWAVLGCRTESSFYWAQVSGGLYSIPQSGFFVSTPYLPTHHPHHWHIFFSL